MSSTLTTGKEECSYFGVVAEVRHLFYKTSKGRSSILLLLLLAIFCCQIHEITSSASRYFSCMRQCSMETKDCTRHCKAEKNCKESRRVCIELCLSAHTFCEKRCLFDFSSKWAT